MRPSRIHRKLTVWIAALALLLATFVPTLSHALKAGDDGSWIEVCSVHGAKRVPAGPQEPDGVPALAQLLAHCAGCVSHAPAAILPPAAHAAPLRLDLKDEHPPAFLSGPRTLHAWTRAHPRATPLSA